jgi:hypothetical protein
MLQYRPANVQCFTSTKNRKKDGLSLFNFKIDIGMPHHLIITVLLSRLTKTNKVSPAQLFFTNSSCVSDFYEGNLAVAMQQGFKSDISVVLLYAPWDADSQLARQEFDVTCRFYSKQVSSPVLEVFSFLAFSYFLTYSLVSSIVFLVLIE